MIMQPTACSHELTAHIGIEMGGAVAMLECKQEHAAPLVRHCMPVPRRSCRRRTIRPGQDKPKGKQRQGLGQHSATTDGTFVQGYSLMQTLEVLLRRHHLRVSQFYQQQAVLPGFNS